MSEIRVTCRNEEEVIKVLEIAEKEGYTWNNNVKATSYRPCTIYPYDLAMCKDLNWGVIGKEKPYTARDFINNYNIDHAEPFGISQKIKNKIILDFMKKWHEIREGCGKRLCRECKFLQDIGDETVCKLCDVDDTGNEERFLNAAKLLIDVVASGDVRILQLTPNEAVEIIKKEIKPLCGKEDDEARGRVEALEMAVRALEERNNK